MSKKSIAEIFIEEAIKTESPITPELIERLTNKRTIRLLHGAMGMVTEGAELLDALKKYIFYGKELDLVNIKEECGDDNWYEAIILHELGASFEEIMVMCIRKLRIRYSDKFSSLAAIDRDLRAERASLEEEFEGTIATNKILHELTEKVVDRVKNEVINDSNPDDMDNH